MEAKMSHCSCSIKQIICTEEVLTNNWRIKGCEGVDWIHLAQEREWHALVNVVMNLQIP
jgi:hypothetical protein